MCVQSVSRFGISVMAIAMMVMCGQASAAASYKYTDLGSGTAYDINKSGQIAGIDGGNAVIWNGTSKTFLGAGTAYGLNDLGQVVGHNNNGPVLWEGGKTVALPNADPASGHVVYEAEDINNAGQIIGQTSDGLPSVGAYWKNDATTPTLLGDKSSFISAINEKGQFVVNGYMATYIQSGNKSIYFNNSPHVVGIADINEAGHTVGNTSTTPAFWFEANGSPMALDSLAGYGGSAPTAINNNDEVVGWAADSPSMPHSGHAVMWNGTAVVDLNTFLPENVANAGWTLVRANEINDNGLIIGEAYNSSLDLQHAFVLAPIPEPETYALFLAGLAMISLLGRRRRVR